ncbi:MAG: TonB-dependent receptor [Prevotellaceae bacterium]|nr:TonB-dependent receptor [Prevotellaceae bacterium]
MKNVFAITLGCLTAYPFNAFADKSTENEVTITSLDAADNSVTFESPDKSGLMDTSRVYDLDEIVVVSQPKEVARLRRQPLSSTVFTGNDLKSIGIRDLNDLSSYVPSFVMPSYGSRLTSSMYIRGIGSRVNNPAVGIYVDGIPLVSKNSFNFHSYQLDRVDVLRGPQGTLYGMNTEGGLVRMYSKNPMTYQGTDVNLGIGTHLYRNVELAHYQKVNDAFAFSLAGFYNGQNGFFKNATTGERADLLNEAGGKTRLVFAPNDRLSFNFIADYQYVRQNAFPYGVLNLVDNSVASPSTNRQNSYKRNMLNTGLNISYDDDVFSFNSTTSYQYQRDYMLMDQDYLPIDYMHLEQRQLMNAITQEFSFKSRNNSAWQWTTGIYGSYQWLKTEAPVYFDEDFTGNIANTILTAMKSAIINSMTSSGTSVEAVEAMIERAGGISMAVAMDVPSVFHTPQFNLGIYHESNISITDRLTATLGLRYDYNRVKAEYDTKAVMSMTANVMGASATNVLSSILANNADDEYNQLLPKFGIIYKLAENGTNVYFTVSKGYRAGGYNIQMFSDILQTELMSNSSKAMRQSYEITHTAADYENVNKTISYKPEESWNYEAGAHLNLFENKIHADFSAYYMQIRNQQLSVMAGTYGFGRMMVNAGKSYSCGIEVALRGSAFEDRLSWAANYGLTHSVFKEYKDSVNGVEVDYKDKKVPFIPMHTFSARADYKIPFNSGAIRSIVFGADVTAQGKTYWDEANTYSQSFYALLGAHADVNMENVSFKVWCRNITDTRYNTFAFSSSASGETLYFAQRGNPFQAGIDIRLHF